MIFLSPVDVIFKAPIERIGFTSPSPNILNAKLLSIKNFKLNPARILKCVLNETKGQQRPSRVFAVPVDLSHCFCTTWNNNNMQPKCYEGEK